MRQSGLILSNAAVSWLMQVLQLFPQLIMVPFLLRTIGESGYGTYALLWPLVMSIENLATSLQSGVVKYSAGYLAQGRTDEVNRAASSCFAYSLMLAVLACGGILAVAVAKAGESGSIGMAMGVAGAIILFVIPLSPFAGIVQAKQRFYIGSIAATATNYLSLAAVFAWFSITGPSVEALIVVMALMLLLSRMIQVPFAYKLVPGLSVSLRLFDKGHFRLVAAFGSATVLVSVFLAANTTGVRWLMGHLASAEFVAHLAIMLIPVSIFSSIVMSVTLTVMPATSAYAARGDEATLREMLIRGMRYTTILVLAGLVAACFLMRPALRHWIGPEYANLSPFALAMLAGNAYMMSTSVAHHMLKGLGKLRSVVIIFLVGMVLLPGTLILVLFRNSDDPYTSVVAGLVAGHLACGILNFAICARTVSAGLANAFLKAQLQPFAVCAATAGPLLGIVLAGGAQGLGIRATAAAAAVAAFLFACHAFILTGHEKRQAHGILQAVSRKFGLSGRAFAVRSKP